MNTERLKVDPLLQVQAFVDGELTPAQRQEVEALLGRDPEMAAWKDAIARVRSVVRSAEPAPRLPESREFYWSQVRRRIEADERRAHREEAVRRPSPLPWLRWLVPALGFAAIAVLFSLPTRSRAGGPVVESSQSEASSVVFRSESEGVTIHWIN